MGFPPFVLREQIRAWIAEDLGHGDITTQLVVDPAVQGIAEIVAHEAGVLCGLPVVELVLWEIDPAIEVKKLCPEGAAIEAGDVVARIEGLLASILAGERLALNLLQRLSGIATLTRAFVSAVQGTRAVILDTRKTTPGLRVLEKYAVRVGGGRNHRFGLSDGILIKENHIRAAGGVVAAVQRARERAPHPHAHHVPVLPHQGSPQPEQ
ncbi:MAG: nicotinate-nucleotide diphosphorylase (carboxylating), partial [Chloroflexota bacterium]